MELSKQIMAASTIRRILLLKHPLHSSRQPQHDGSGGLFHTVGSWWKRMTMLMPGTADIQASFCGSFFIEQMILKGPPPRHSGWFPILQCIQYQPPVSGQLDDTTNRTTILGSQHRANADQSYHGRWRASLRLHPRPAAALPASTRLAREA